MKVNSRGKDFSSIHRDSCTSVCVFANWFAHKIPFSHHEKWEYFEDDDWFPSPGRIAFLFFNASLQVKSICRKRHGLYFCIFKHPDWLETRPWRLQVCSLESNLESNLETAFIIRWQLTPSLWQLPGTRLEPWPLAALRGTNTLDHSVMGQPGRKKGFLRRFRQL